MININIKATPLSNVRGRIDYISNPARQEHLVATCSTTADQTFWSALAAHCQEQAKYSQSKNACEGREFMAALPNEFAVLNPEYLAKKLSQFFKEQTGTENMVALHWNKRRTNFHVHVICAENKEINLVKEGAVLTRNTYYDANGSRSCKKDCVDPITKELLPGCKMLKKGERLKTVIRFGPKQMELADDKFLADLKQATADLINQELGEERMQVYKNDGMHLKQQHIGNRLQDESKKAAIRAKNALVKEWNRTVDMILAISSSQQDVEDLKHSRNDIKKHRQTPNWLRAIHFHLQRWQEVLQKMLQKESETFRTASESLADKIQRANAKQQNKNTNINQKQSRGHNMSL